MKVRSYLKTTLFTFFISTQGFSCEYIDDQYERRRQKFNGQRDEKEYAQHTQNTNKLLSDYDKVSCVPATLDQKKSIIKTTMTKFFVHKNTEQYRLSFRVLKETDKNYRHFKVLEQTEALSDKLARKLVDKDGVKTIDRDFLSAHWDDHKELDEFGKITQEMFLVWFNEALSEHNNGFSDPQFTVGFSKPNTPLRLQTSSPKSTSIFSTISPQNSVPHLAAIRMRKNNEEEDKKKEDREGQNDASLHIELFSPIRQERDWRSECGSNKPSVTPPPQASSNPSADTTPDRLSDLMLGQAESGSHDRLPSIDLYLYSNVIEQQEEGGRKSETLSDVTDCSSDAGDDSFHFTADKEFNGTKDEDNDKDREWEQIKADNSPIENVRQKKSLSVNAAIAKVLKKITLWS